MFGVPDRLVAWLRVSGIAFGGGRGGVDIS